MPLVKLALTDSTACAVINTTNTITQGASGTSCKFPDIGEDWGIVQKIDVKSKLKVKSEVDTDKRIKSRMSDVQLEKLFRIGNRVSIVDVTKSEWVGEIISRFWVTQDRTLYIQHRGTTNTGRNFLMPYGILLDRIMGAKEIFTTIKQTKFSNWMNYWIKFLIPHLTEYYVVNGAMAEAESKYNKYCNSPYYINAYTKYERRKEGLEDLLDNFYILYLSMASAGESRNWTESFIEYHEIEKIHKELALDIIGRGCRGIRYRVWEEVFDRWGTIWNQEDKISMLKALERVFTGFRWRKGYGGVKWAEAVTLVIDRLTNKISKPVFVDTAVNLTHNSNNIIDKLLWVPHCVKHYKWLLNTKAEATDALNLLRRVSVLARGKHALKEAGEYNIPWGQYRDFITFKGGKIVKEKEKTKISEKGEG